MKNVFIVDGSQAYVNLFKDLGFSCVYALELADFVCFTGGADVTPGIYGDKGHPTTHNSVFRDNEEALIVDDCVAKGIPMVGICRGGQFLNVMGGGRMYQDVSNHCLSHLITDLRTGEELLVSSTHHQMMMPSPMGLVVATAGIPSRREWFDGRIPRDDVSDVGIEVVYYSNIHALCFQPHPEFGGYHAMRQYFKGLLKEFLQV